MKKVIYLVVITISLLLITGCGNSSYLHNISFGKLNEKLDNGDSFILTIIQDGCSHCAIFKPRFESVLNEYKVNAYALNISTLSDEEYASFEDLFGTKIGTPTTIIIENGQEKTKINRFSGESSKNEIIRKLKQNGYIEEK